MSNRILPLVLLLLLAIAAGYWMVLQQQPEEITRKALFPSLQSAADQISEVRISNSEQVLLDARKTDQGWMALHLHDEYSYPVDQERLAELVSAVVNSKLQEAKTSRVENYPRLGVEGLDAPDSQSVLVEISAGQDVWQLLVGIDAKSGSGSYARIPQKQQSWLLDRRLVMPTSTSNWLQQPLIQLDDAAVSRVSRITDPLWTVEKSDAAQLAFTLRDMPEDRELQYPSVLDSAVSSITGLRFEQILPFDQDQWQAMEPAAELQMSTFDGAVMDIDVARQDEKAFVRISGTELADYYQGWMFEISDFSANQLSRSVEDFLSQPPSEEPAGPPAPATPE